ncbi:hypothetical protein TGRH88_021700 [Toxoplasma gondii]|uniref:Uncharacterized protein n=1 Tax=Toxoplasma gondii TaxID=5811 RepID=A0A7J6KG08_TOXGO|nr:hypothetical protein TGRH88_021700 [Toxoplasma gondii]
MEKPDSFPTLASSIEWFSSTPQPVLALLSSSSDGSVKGSAEGDGGEEPNSFTSLAGHPSSDSWSDDRRTQTHASVSLPRFRFSSKSPSLSPVDSHGAPPSSSLRDGSGASSLKGNSPEDVSIFFGSSRVQTAESALGASSALRWTPEEASMAPVVGDTEEGALRPVACAIQVKKELETQERRANPLPNSASDQRASACTPPVAPYMCPFPSLSRDFTDGFVSASNHTDIAPLACAAHDLPSASPLGEVESTVGLLTKDEPPQCKRSSPNGGLSPLYEVDTSAPAHPRLPWISPTHPSVVASPPSSPVPEGLLRCRSPKTPLWLSPVSLPPSKRGVDKEEADAVKPDGQMNEGRLPASFSSSSTVGDCRGHMWDGVSAWQESQKRPVSSRGDPDCTPSCSHSLSASCPPSVPLASLANPLAPPPLLSTVSELAALFEPSPGEEFFLDVSPATADLSAATLLPGSAFLESEFISSLSLSLPAVVSFLFSLFNGDPGLGILTPQAKFMAWRSLVYLSDLHEGKVASSPAAESGAGALGRGGYRAAAARGPFYRGQHAQPQAQPPPVSAQECVATSKGKRSVRHALVGERPAPMSAPAGQVASSGPTSSPHGAIQASGPAGPGPASAVAQPRGLFGRCLLPPSRPSVSEAKGEKKETAEAARGLDHFDFFKVPRTRLPGLPIANERDCAEAQESWKAAEELWAAARASTSAATSELASGAGPEFSSDTKRPRGCGPGGDSTTAVTGRSQVASVSTGSGNVAGNGGRRSSLPGEETSREVTGVSGASGSTHDDETVSCRLGQGARQHQHASAVGGGVCRKGGAEAQVGRSEVDRRRGEGDLSHFDEDKLRAAAHAERRTESVSQTPSSVATSSSPQGESFLHEQMHLLAQIGDEQQILGYEENFPRFVCGTIDRRWALQQRTVKVPLDKTLTAREALGTKKPGGADKESPTEGGGSKRKGAQSDETGERDKPGSLVLELQFEEIRYSAAKRMWPKNSVVLPEKLTPGLQVQVACYAKILERGDNSANVRKSRLGWKDDESRLVWRDGEVTKVLPASGEIYVRVQASYQDYKSMKYSVTDFVPPSLPIARPRDKLWRLRPPKAHATRDIYPGSCICMSITPSPSSGPASASARPVFYVDAVVHKVFYSSEESRECRRRCAKVRSEQGGVGSPKAGRIAPGVSTPAVKWPTETSQVPSVWTKRRPSEDQTKGASSGASSATTKQGNSSTEAAVSRGTRLQRSLLRSASRAGDSVAGNVSPVAPSPSSGTGQNRPRTRRATGATSEVGGRRDRGATGGGADQRKEGEKETTTRHDSGTSPASHVDEEPEGSECGDDESDLTVESLVHPMEGLRCPEGRTPVELHVVLLSGGTLTEDVCRVSGRQILKLPYDLHAHFDEFSPDISRHVPPDLLSDEDDEAASEKGASPPVSSPGTDGDVHGPMEETGNPRRSGALDAAGPTPLSLPEGPEAPKRARPLEIPRAAAQANAFMWVVPRALSHEVAYTAKGRTRTFSSDYFFPTQLAGAGPPHHSDHRGWHHGQSGTSGLFSLSPAPCLADPSRWDSRTKDRAKDWLDYPPFVICCFRFHPDSRYYRDHTQLVRYLQPELDVTALAKGTWKLKFPVYRPHPDDGDQLLVHPSGPAPDAYLCVEEQADKKAKVEAQDGERPVGLFRTDAVPASFGGTAKGEQQPEEALGGLLAGPSSGDSRRGMSSDGGQAYDSAGLKPRADDERVKEAAAVHGDNLRGAEQAESISGEGENSSNHQIGEEADERTAATVAVKKESAALGIGSANGPGVLSSSRGGAKRNREQLSEGDSTSELWKREEGKGEEQGISTRESDTFTTNAHNAADITPAELENLRKCEGGTGLTVADDLAVNSGEGGDEDENEPHLPKRQKPGASFSFELERPVKGAICDNQLKQSKGWSKATEDRMACDGGRTRLQPLCSEETENKEKRQQGLVASDKDSGVGSDVGRESRDSGTEKHARGEKKGQEPDSWSVGDVKVRLWRLLANERERRRELARETLLDWEDYEGATAGWQLRAAAATGGVDVEGPGGPEIEKGEYGEGKGRRWRSERFTRGLEACGMRLVPGLGGREENGRGATEEGRRRKETDDTSDSTFLRSDPWQRDFTQGSTRSGHDSATAVDREGRARIDRNRSGLSFSDVARFLLRQQPVHRVEGKGVTSHSTSSAAGYDHLEQKKRRMSVASLPSSSSSFPCDGPGMPSYRCSGSDMPASHRGGDESHPATHSRRYGSAHDFDCFEQAGPSREGRQRESRVVCQGGVRASRHLDVHPTPEGGANGDWSEAETSVWALPQRERLLEGLSEFEDALLRRDGTSALAQLLKASRRRFCAAREGPRSEARHPFHGGNDTHGNDECRREERIWGYGEGAPSHSGFSTPKGNAAFREPCLEGRRHNRFRDTLRDFEGAVQRQGCHRRAEGGSDPSGSGASTRRPSRSGGLCLDEDLWQVVRCPRQHQAGEHISEPDKSSRGFTTLFKRQGSETVASRDQCGNCQLLTASQWGGCPAGSPGEDKLPYQGSRRLRERDERAEDRRRVSSKGVETSPAFAAESDAYAEMEEDGDFSVPWRTQKEAISDFADEHSHVLRSRLCKGSDRMSGRERRTREAASAVLSSSEGACTGAADFSRIVLDRGFSAPSSVSFSPAPSRSRSFSPPSSGIRDSYHSAEMPVDPRFPQHTEAKREIADSGTVAKLAKIEEGGTVAHSQAKPVVTRGDARHIMASADGNNSGFSSTGRRHSPPHARRRARTPSSSGAGSSRRSSLTSAVDGQSVTSVRTSPALSAASLDGTVGGGGHATPPLSTGAGARRDAELHVTHSPQARSWKASGGCLPASVSENAPEGSGDNPGEDEAVTPERGGTVSRRASRKKPERPAGVPSMGTDVEWVSSQQVRGSEDGERHPDPCKRIDRSSPNKPGSSRRASREVSSPLPESANLDEDETALSGPGRRLRTLQSSGYSPASAEQVEQAKGPDAASGDGAPGRSGRRRPRASRAPPEGGKGGGVAGGSGDTEKQISTNTQSKRPRRVAAEGASRVWTGKQIDVESHGGARGEDEEEDMTGVERGGLAGRDSDEDFVP